MKLGKSGMRVHTVKCRNWGLPSAPWMVVRVFATLGMARAYCKKHNKPLEHPDYAVESYPVETYE